MVAQWVTNLNNIHEDAGLIPGLTPEGEGSSIAVSWGRSKMPLGPHVALTVV